MSNRNVLFDPASRAKLGVACPSRRTLPGRANHGPRAALRIIFLLVAGLFLFRFGLPG